MMLVSSLLQDILSLLVTLFKYYLAQSRGVTHNGNEYKLKRVPSSQIPMAIVCKKKRTVFIYKPTELLQIQEFRV